MYRVLKLNENNSNSNERLKRIFGDIQKDSNDPSGYIINNSPIAAYDFAIDENGEPVEGITFYTVEDSNVLFPRVASGNLEIQAPKFIKDKNGVEYGDSISFIGDFEDEDKRAFFDELLVKIKNYNPDDKDEEGYARIIESEDLDNQEVEDKAEEDINDTIEDDAENEEYATDSKLDELRDVLVDLDWKLYMINTGNEDEVYYVIGRINGDETELLSDTGTDDNHNFVWIPQPMSLAEVLKMNTVYGQDLEPDHEAILDFLMKSLEEEEPEKAAELADEEEIEDDVPETAGISLDNLEKEDNEDEE